MCLRLGNDYKAFIGPAKLYEQIGKTVFDVVLNQGLKKYHRVLDIGCGSLRVGQHLINYLNKGNYYGLEPNKWLIDEALTYEKIKEDKEPNFSYKDDFSIEFDTDFNMVIANSIFIHASKKQIETCIKNVMDKLNGKFIFNFIPGKDCNKNNWSYPGAVTYSKKYIESLLKDYDYKYVECDYPGRQVFIVVEKKAENKRRKKDDSKGKEEILCRHDILYEVEGEGSTTREEKYEGDNS